MAFKWPQTKVWNNAIVRFFASFWEEIFCIALFARAHVFLTKISRTETLLTMAIPSWATGNLPWISNCVLQSATKPGHQFFIQTKAESLERRFLCQGVREIVAQIAWGPEWWLYCTSGDLSLVISWNLRSSFWDARRRTLMGRRRNSNANIPQKIKTKIL